MIEKAWRAVTPLTIHNCFKKSGFSSPNLVVVDNTLPEFNAVSLWEALPEQDLTFKGTWVPSPLNDYVLVDTDIAVWGALSDAEIVALDHNNTESDEDESDELTPVTLKTVCTPSRNKTSPIFSVDQEPKDRREGRKITDVAREFDIAPSVVLRLWKSFKTTGMCSRRHGGGRVRSTTPAKDIYIVLSAKRNRRTTAQQVANQFLAASGKQISRKTVARRLRGGGLYARRPVVCVPLTRQHRTARLQWCREHHNWTEQDWACVLFSDESSSVCHRIVDAN
ncbi:transposable element Tcb2 transposase [Trichonephila clavipes]|uniref:Transposable element Tcb2 transposase n=1 Tax=Trichonephila clavipes TaxID=2585209 RepID=A0A8X6VMJ7_TRICX|nr:transposable element Tcb2 transposase [Trichonephila clavipes]